MTGGMKGYRGSADLEFLPERNAFELGLLA